MIFLRTETGSQKIDNWEAITSRPNFVAKIVKGDHKFEEIIGYYQFKDKLHCGLASCNQPHQKGYIVRTASGTETNFGNTCGKNEFGVEFAEHTESFDKFMRLETNKDIVAQAKLKCHDWIIRAESLRKVKPSIDYCATNIEKIQNANHSGRLASTEVRLLAKNQTGLVTLSEVETDNTAKTILFSMNKHMRETGEATTEYEIGKVSFSHVLLPENNLRELYVSLMGDIKNIQGIDLANAPSPVIADIAKLANLIEDRLKSLKMLLHDAGKFLTKKNLSPIANKLKYSSTADESEFDHFDSFIRTLKR